MDADLQDPPHATEMKALLRPKADLDCVGTRRTSRGEPFSTIYGLAFRCPDFAWWEGLWWCYFTPLTESNRFSKGLACGFKRISWLSKRWTTGWQDPVGVFYSSFSTDWMDFNFFRFPLSIAFVAGLYLVLFLLWWLFVVFRLSFWEIQHWLTLMSFSLLGGVTWPHLWGVISVRLLWN